MFPKLGDDEMIGDLMKNNNGDVVDNGNNNNNNNRLSRWHHNSSRIIRVSRASGGKDRHSKVLTSKGPRDRRVRLSVSTALQFYDLQDRLGYDQPSKAVEWLIKAAEDSISELPSLNNTNFLTDDENPNQNQTLATVSANSLSKSACSSNSDTSKNSSGLSLSRSELRDKARERARERTAKETKERDHQQNNSHTSFTDLLNSGSDPVNANRQWMAPSSSPAPMEYFSSGLILGSGQPQYPIQTNSHPFSAISDHHHHHNHQHHPHQEFSFVPDHLISPAGSNGGAFNLDFNMSTTSGAGAAVSAASGGGFSGFNRGTLQSNSTNHHQSFLSNLQRFPTSSEGGGGPQFLFGALPAENHHHHHHNQNHQFQLYYENGCRNSDHKGKGKN